MNYNREGYLNRGNRHMVAACLALTLLFSGTANAATVSVDTGVAMATTPSNEQSAVIVKLPTVAPPAPLMPGLRSKAVQKAMAKSMKAAARVAQAPLLDELRARVDRGEVSDVKSLWLGNAVAMKATPGALRELSAAYPDAHIVLDNPLVVPADPPITALGALNGVTGVNDDWGLTEIEADLMWADGYEGQGVTVAIMDTGVDMNHPALASSAFGGPDGWCDVVDPASGNPSSTCPGSSVPTEVTSSGTTLDAHGTGVASVIVGQKTGAAPGTPLGVAPKADWMAVRIFDDTGSANESDAIAGLQWLVGLPDPPEVLNMSWEVGTTLDTAVQCRNRAAVDDPANNVVADPLRGALYSLRNTFGVFIVAASGNQRDPVLPAAFGEVFAVGAIRPNGTMWDLGTNIGSGGTSANVPGCEGRGPNANLGDIPYPNVVAPGENILVADFSSNGLDNVATNTGTSYSAPHVAGAAALLLSAYPNMTVDTLTKALSDPAVAVVDPDPNVDTSLVKAPWGYGRVKTSQSMDWAASAAAGAPHQLARPSDAWLTSEADGVHVHWNAPRIPAGVTVTYTIKKNGTTLATAVSGTSYTDTTPGSTVGVYQVIATDQAAAIAASDPAVAALGNINRSSGPTADRVDAFDLVVLEAVISGSISPVLSLHDLDNSGAVNSADLQLLKAQLGSRVTP